MGDDSGDWEIDAREAAPFLVTERTSSATDRSAVPRSPPARSAPPAARRRPPNRVTRVVLAVAVIVAVSVILVESGPIAQYSLPPPPATSDRTATYVWDEASYEGPLAGGVNQSVEIEVPAVPNATATVYVDGSFAMRAWTLLDQGHFQSAGNCASGFEAVGACSVYVGIWTPANWSAYLHGGPMRPLWCYPGNGSACENESIGGFATPNLHEFDGLPWEIVVWNLANYSLSGDYQFTVYTSGPSG